MRFRPSITAEEIDEKIPWGDNPVWRSADIPSGWYRLVWDLVENLNRLDCGYAVNQVKEKFGGLRFYYEVDHSDNCPGMDDWIKCPIAALVHAAESLSYKVCESCGNAVSAPRPDAAQGPLALIAGTLCERCRTST